MTKHTPKPAETEQTSDVDLSKVFPDTTDLNDNKQEGAQDPGAALAELCDELLGSEGDDDDDNVDDGEQ